MWSKFEYVILMIWSQPKASGDNNSFYADDEKSVNA